jgi:antitoxin component of RelBE/YafQ-DinJ toxin-antitoxin module
MSKDDYISTRIDAELKERFADIAKDKRRKPADLLRIVIEEYVAAEKKTGGKRQQLAATAK